jgi:general secretion pathway protein B
VSFILDALKKSENERQRQAGPGFATVPDSAAARPRRIWPVVVIALLIVNLVVIGAIVLRDKEAAPTPATARPPPGGPATADAGSTPAPRQIPVAPPGSTTPAVTTRQKPPETTARPQVSTATPDTGVPAESGRDRVIRPLAEEAGAAATPAPAAARPAPIGPRPAPAEPGPGPSAAGDLPTANDLRLEGFLTGVPLHLDLHVYYPDSRRRVVFISGSKYREGDTVNGGPVIREIVPEGVILEERGRRYLLMPD